MTELSKIRGPLYWSGGLYRSLLKLWHGETLDERYTYMADQIGSNSVLDVGCGPALLLDYLPEDNDYHGFDVNYGFLQHAKQRFASRGNALFSLADGLNSPYSKDSVDTVVLCDAVHHFNPDDQEKLIQDAWNLATSKLIICEPYIDATAGLSINKIPGVYKLLQVVYNFLDNDGLGQVRHADMRTKVELERDMREGFEIIPETAEREIVEFGEDLIVTYTK